MRTAASVRRYATIRQLLTVFLSICSELCASVCHTSHRNKHYLLLCPHLDNVLLLAFVNIYINKNITLLAVGCILNFLLIGDCGCFHSILSVCGLW